MNTGNLVFIDKVIIASYFVIVLLVGLLVTKKASGSLADYFVSGRSLPWWLAGTSMVATTFAADTPLAVTNLVIKHGVAGNWLWWNMVFSGMLTVFFFARLWRRSQVLTDVELISLRYGGKPAKFLRLFRALYLSLPINSIIIAWVTLAMAKVLGVTLGVGKMQAIVVSSTITVIYVTLSGLWGVVITDFIQFIMAMAGCIALAYYSVKYVGGINSLTDKLTAKFGSADAILSIVPDFSNPETLKWLPFSAFFVYIAVQWWATWYPGAEPGGGGYIVQRMLACKNEKHSFLATLWFNIAHYALRPWPWILVALCAMVVYPELVQKGADAEKGFPMMMNLVLPHGWRGLLLVSFFAAYMSTLSTQLNWGASYLVNDFYKVLIPDKSDKHYTLIGKSANIVLIVLGGIVAMYANSIKGMWELMLSVGAGTGLVFILRWYWWRINAWSEISGMITSLLVAIIIRIFEKNTGADIKGYIEVVIVGVISSFVWLIVTFITPPENEKTLEKFYRKVYPSKIGWKPIAEKCKDIKVRTNFSINFLNWFLSCILIFITLYGFEMLIFGKIFKGIICVIISLGIISFIIYTLGKSDKGVLLE